jgi:hypothetical protein
MSCICILCGEEVENPIQDEDFVMANLNAHRECWDKYNKWYDEYVLLHHKHFSK